MARRGLNQYSDQYRHRVRQDGGAWLLETHYGYELTRGTQDEVREYYAYHCPADDNSLVRRG